MSDKIEYKQVNLSLTPSHLDRLDKIAFRRTFNRSLMARTLIDEEWVRLDMDKWVEEREAQRRGRTSE